MKDNQKAVMQQMLQDVVTHFSKDPVGLRAIYSFGGCFYTRVLEKSADNIGCAIGMYLTDKQAKEAQGHGYIYEVIAENPRCLPKWMKELNKNFLAEVQILHDKDYFWSKENISSMGRIKVKEICKEFHLDFKKIKFKK